MLLFSEAEILFNEKDLRSVTACLFIYCLNVKVHLGKLTFRSLNDDVKGTQKTNTKPVLTDKVVVLSSAFVHFAVRGSLLATIENESQNLVLFLSFVKEH